MVHLRWEAYEHVKALMGVCLPLRFAQHGALLVDLGPAIGKKRGWSGVADRVMGVRAPVRPAQRRRLR